MRKDRALSCVPLMIPSEKMIRALALTVTREPGSRLCTAILQTYWPRHTDFPNDRSPRSSDREKERDRLECVLDGTSRSTAQLDYIARVNQSFFPHEDWIPFDLIIERVKTAPPRNALHAASRPAKTRSSPGRQRAEVQEAFEARQPSESFARPETPNIGGSQIPLSKRLPDGRWLYGSDIRKVAYTALLDAQNGCCGGCGRELSHEVRHHYDIPYEMRGCIDHDHITQIVRGILCHECNKILGIVKDYAPRLRGLALYLEDAQVRDKLACELAEIMP